MYHVLFLKQTRNTLAQASKNGRKPYLFPQKKFVSVFYAINIFNTMYYFKPTNLNMVRRENAFCKFHTFFGFVSCLPWFETKKFQAEASSQLRKKIKAVNFFVTISNLKKRKKYNTFVILDLFIISIPNSNTVKVMYM